VVEDADALERTLDLSESGARAERGGRVRDGSVSADPFDRPLAGQFPMPVPCHFHCGDSAAHWDWNGAGAESADPALRDITVYACPNCGIYGISGRVEACFRSQKPWDQQIEKQFLLMRKDLLRRRPKEAPLGSDQVGIFTMMENKAGLQLVFLNSKIHTS
jgi:hypothetical protein